MGQTSQRERLPPETRRFASAIRVPHQGPLDIHGTADRLGLTVRLVPRLDSHGLTLGNDNLLLDRRLTEKDRRIVFAHEVGHVFVRRGELMPSPDEEIVADQFGDELAIPSEVALRDPEAGTAALANQFKVPRSRAASQLARVGLIPSLTRLSSGEVICARCGDRKASGCGCLYYRVNGHKAARLPLAS